jgi:hypothetical protein
MFYRRNVKRPPLQRLMIQKIILIFLIARDLELCEAKVFIITAILNEKFPLLYSPTKRASKINKNF